MSVKGAVCRILAENIKTLMRILIRMCHLFSYSEHTEGSTSPANCCCELQSIHHDCSCCQPVSSVSRAASQTHGSFGPLRVRGFQAPCQQVSMLTSVYTTPKLLFIHTALIIFLTKFLTYCSFLIYVINSLFGNSNMLTLHQLMIKVEHVKSC